MKIGIADPQGRVRFSLRVLLEQQAGWIIAGEAADCDELFTMILCGSLDLLLLDWDLPSRATGNLLRLLRSQLPELKIIVMSVRQEVQTIAVKAGADAFASKTDSPEKLLSMIRALCDRNDHFGEPGSV